MMERTEHTSCKILSPNSSDNPHKILLIGRTIEPLELVLSILMKSMKRLKKVLYIVFKKFERF